MHRASTDVLDPVGKQVVASLSAVTAATLTIPENASRAKISVESQAVRYYETGDNPTTTDGHPQAAGTTFVIEGRNALRQLRLISQSASAKLTVTYYR